jgi:adhesin/invasin
MVKNDSLITYERAFGSQADEGKFPKSTFLERKIMSTKTSFKRIALVAASALALGGFSVISAPQVSAAPQVVAATNGMYDTTNFYQVVGGQATIEIGFDTNVVATVSSTGVGSIVSATPKAGAGLGFETLTSVTSTGFQHNAAGSGYGAQMLDTVTVVLSSAVAGAQVITITPLSTSGVPGTTVSKTITWTASGTLAASKWTAYLMDTDTAIGVAPTDSDVALSFDKGTTASSAEVAMISAKLTDGNGNPVNAATVSVTISGPGFIAAAAAGTTNGTGTSPDTTPNNRVASVTTDANGWVIVSIGPDGTAGVSTVTLTAGTVSVSRSITFTGAAASYSVTGLTTTYKVGANGTGDDNSAYVAASMSEGILVKGLDSAGGAAASGDFYAVSSNPLVASVTSAAKTVRAAGTVVGVTGVSVGTATITIRNNSTAALSTVTKTFEVEVSTGTAATVTMALDKAEYQPGEPGVLSITLTNAAGRPVADGTYTIFAATAPLTSNLYMQNNASGSNDTFTAGATSVTTVGGVAKYDIYAPSFSGTLTITATTLGATTSSSALATGAVRGAVLAATATVSGGAADANAALALDAANAATDAANNAYDEAQNATQAASDALAAVTALAAQVKTLIASVKKLTAAVAKLKK